MSERKWAFRVCHMLEAIEEIQAYTKTMDMEDFENNRLVQRAVERCFEILGESSAKVPDDIKKLYLDIPWAKIKGMRNFVAHDYDQVLHASVWNTIQNDLPALYASLKNIELPKDK